MAQQGFGVEVGLLDRGAILHLKGELDLESAPELRDCVATVVGRGVCQITMDLAELSFVDSTGLTVLVQTLKRLRERGGELTLRAPTASTMRVLEITGLTQVLPVTDAAPSPASGSN